MILRPVRAVFRTLWRFGTAARFVIAGVLFLGILFLGVFPTRTYLDQRDSIQASRERLEVLRSQTERLRLEIERLETPEAIERIAREEYNLARPGEEVFRIIPSELEALRRTGIHASTVDAVRRAWGIPAVIPLEDDAE